MRDVSLFIALGGGGPEAITQATSWAQKGLDVVNTTRESHKGKPECDTAFILLLYHLGWMQIVSEIFIFIFIFFRISFIKILSLPPDIGRIRQRS